MNRVVRLSGPIDVHVISRQSADRPGTSRGLPRRSRAPLAPPAAHRRLVARTRRPPADDGRPGRDAAITSRVGGVLLMYVLMVVAVAAVGGLAPAVVAAIGGFLG